MFVCMLACNYGLSSFYKHMGKTKKRKKKERGGFSYCAETDKIVDSEALLQETMRKRGSFLQSTVPTCLFRGLTAPIEAGFVRCKLLTLERRHRECHCWASEPHVHCKTIKCNGRDFEN